MAANKRTKELFCHPKLKDLDTIFIINENKPTRDDPSTPDLQEKGASFTLMSTGVVENEFFHQFKKKLIFLKW